MRKAHSRIVRTKLSTTVARETYEFLQDMVAAGEVSSIAEAVDAAVATVRRAENRKALAAATARYFDQMPPHAVDQENSLARDMASAGSAIDFDREI